MFEIDYLSGDSDWIELDVECKRTSERAMKLDIRMCIANYHFQILSLFLRSRVSGTRGEAPNRVALDESVIHINDQQFWPYVAANLRTSEMFHLRLFSTTTTALTGTFPRSCGKDMTS